MSRAERTGRRVFEGILVDVCQDPAPEGAVAHDVCIHRGAVAVLANRGGTLLLVRQYRYAVGCECLEIPAGKLDAGEDPAAAARRELREETGMACGRLLELGRLCSSPDVLSEVLYLYYADQLRYVGEAPDEGEFLDVVPMGAAQLCQAVAAGAVRDAKTICALQWARARGLLEG